MSVHLRKWQCMQKTCPCQNVPSHGRLFTHRDPQLIIGVAIIANIFGQLIALASFDSPIDCQSLYQFFFLLLRYHRSSSSIKCHVYLHVGGRRHTPVVCNEKREPHTSHYTSRTITKKNNQQTTHIYIYFLRGGNNV